MDLVAQVTDVMWWMLAPLGVLMFVALLFTEWAVDR